MKATDYDSLAMLYFKARLRLDFICLDGESTAEEIGQAKEIVNLAKLMWYNSMTISEKAARRRKDND